MPKVTNDTPSITDNTAKSPAGFNDGTVLIPDIADDRLSIAESVPGYCKAIQQQDLSSPPLAKSTNGLSYCW